MRSPASNSWSELGVDTAAPGLVHDAGDVSLNQHADALQRIEASIAALLETGYLPLALGGDHAVTVPAVRAVSRIHRRLTVVQVDAHPDLYPEYEGDPNSHACTAARIMDQHLADRLVQLGIRTMNDIQRDQARRFGVEVFEMRHWEGKPPPVDGPIYLSIDIDAIDPGLAPGVSHHEPGGLTVRDVIRIIHSCAGHLVGADIVEYNPRNDPTSATAVVCAKLVKEVIGTMAAAQSVTT